MVVIWKIDFFPFPESQLLGTQVTFCISSLPPQTWTSQLSGTKLIFCAGGGVVAQGQTAADRESNVGNSCLLSQVQSLEVFSPEGLSVICL